MFFEYGEDALFDGASDSVRVIFNAPHASLPADGIGMADNRPTLLIRSGDVPCEASEDDADIGIYLSEAETLRPGFPTRYWVTEVHPDGTGISTLVLRGAGE